MLAQVDSDGHSVTLICAIINHHRHPKVESLLNKLPHYEEQTEKIENNDPRMVDFLLKWKDASDTWIKLSDMKASHPIKVAIYACAQN